MTGAILPDFASVATGKERPRAKLKLVKALLDTCEAPLMMKNFCGMFLVLPATFIPKNPTHTLANASRNCKNQA